MNPGAVLYTIRHVTRFRYLRPVRESVMEIMMQPRSEGLQTLRSFALTPDPRAQVFSYTDHLGNIVHNFDILRAHEALSIDAVSQVEMRPMPALPEALDPLEWDRLSANLREEHYDFLYGGGAAQPTPAIDAFLADAGLTAPPGCPLTALRRLGRAIFQGFTYEEGATDVETPVDDVLEMRRGVCQDFTHVMIAAARRWNIPVRYVSGYLHTSPGGHVRTAPNATHAWMEAWLPSLGWVGFDPANDQIAAERHIRVAVGRDYQDVPPHRGIFKGHPESELSLAVSVTAGPPGGGALKPRVIKPMALSAEGDFFGLHHQQQQQQQARR